MKKLMFATLALVLFTPSVFWAQDTATAPQEKQTKKPMSHTKIVTGCLQKGDEPGEFSITGQDGRTWGLRSSNVKLEQHVGHQVTVTGSAHREWKAQEKAEEKKEGQMENAAGKEEYDKTCRDPPITETVEIEIWDRSEKRNGQYRMHEWRPGGMTVERS